MCRRLRGQARSHRVRRCSLKSGTPQNHCGSLPASDSGGSGHMGFEWTDAFASKPAPTGIGGGSGISSSSRSTVGAWLARDGGGSADRDVECADAFAGKPAPTGSGGVHSNRAHHKITVGACLQAIAVGQATWILNGLAPSRAGSLPQGSGVDRDIQFIPIPQVPSRIRVYSVIFEKLR